MLKLWTLKEGLAKVENLKLYLFAATRNTSLNYIYKMARRATEELDQEYASLVADQLCPEESLMKREWKKEVAQAVTNLPVKCRQAYQLVRENGCSYKEVATLMNISENTVDRHLNNAHHKLTSALKVYTL